MRSRRLSLAFFILLFPGFLLLNFLLANGFIPQFVVGGFGEVAAIAIVVLGLAILREGAKGSMKVRTMDLLVLAFFLFVATWTAVHLLFAPSETMFTAAIQVATSVALWAALYLVGRYLAPALDAHRTLLTVVSGALVASLAAAYLLSRGVALYESGLYPYYSTANTVASYQQLARSVLVSGVVTMGIGRTPIAHRLVFGGLMVLALAFIGARSELIAGVVAVSLLLAVSAVRRPALAIAVFGLTLTGTGIIVAVSGSDVVSGLLSENYRLATFLRLDLDESLRARAELGQGGIQTIERSPLFGDIASHIGPEQQRGSYRHDVLSAWVSFGLVGFLLYVAVFFGAAGLVAAHFRQVLRQETMWLTAFLFMSITLLLAIFTKSVFWELPALAWGFVAGASANPARSPLAATSVREVRSYGT